MVKAYYHLPGLFEFYELYRVFLPLYREHRDWFYDWCEIGSIYGAPADCIWGGGRAGFGENDPKEVLALMQEYGLNPIRAFNRDILRNSSCYSSSVKHTHFEPESNRFQSFAVPHVVFNFYFFFPIE